MSGNVNSLLVPRLRFPEFGDAGEWRQTELGNEATILKGKGIAKSDIVPDGVLPCIRYGELYTHYNEIINLVISRTNLPANNLFLSIFGDVIIPSSGETKLDIAKASCVLLNGVALGGDLNVIRSAINGSFLSYYLNGPQKYNIAEVAQGDTVVHLYSSQLKKLSLAYPTSSEQKKIADCLSSLDERIAAEANKLDTLKVHKNGLMQQLFPAEGQTIPRLRFPEFRLTLWPKRRLSTLLLKLVRPVSVDPNRMYQEIGIRSHGRGVFHKEPVSGITLGDKRVFWVEEDALVVNIVFAWEQAVSVTSAKEKGLIASHRFPMYKPYDNRADVKFFKYFFLTKKGKELLGIASPGGAGRNKTLGQSEFAKLEFLSPENVAEQTAIANALSSLDDLITAQTHKIDLLKRHKQGLMQQLFPVLDEDPA